MDAYEQNSEGATADHRLKMKTLSSKKQTFDHGYLPFIVYLGKKSKGRNCIKKAVLNNQTPILLKGVAYTILH